MRSPRPRIICKKAGWQPRQDLGLRGEAAGGLQHQAERRAVAGLVGEARRAPGQRQPRFPRPGDTGDAVAAQRHRRAGVPAAQEFPGASSATMRRISTRWRSATWPTGCAATGRSSPPGRRTRSRSRWRRASSCNCCSPCTASMTAKSTAISAAAAAQAIRDYQRSHRPDAGLAWRAATCCSGWKRPARMAARSPRK